jgi:hypothetical protein
MRPPWRAVRSMMSNVVRQCPGTARRLNRPKVIGRPLSMASLARSSYQRRAFSASPRGSPATSTMPPPIALTRVSNSSQVASRLATGLSSEVMWLTLRVVEKPCAPAAIDSRV